MALMTKYRPKDFDSFYGSADTVTALHNTVNRAIEDIPNTFLFHGPSGCGKTTLARIVANVYLKASGRDIIEIDSADYRGIDSVRDIRKKMHLSPISGSQSVVYILDECHQMTKDAQNALLKALEDTPKKTFFMLCTTEPEKLLKTIQTRSVSFKVDLLEDDIMEELIAEVCEEEKFTLSKKHISMLVNKAEGSPRQALNLLDKVVGLDKDEIGDIFENFTTQETRAKELAQALIYQHSWAKVKVILKDLVDDPEGTRRAVMGYCTAVLLGNSKKNFELRAFLVLDAFKETFFYSGKAGLVHACYYALEAE
jgi:DNA polymerase-3 subunit gamma/tau